MKESRAVVERKDSAVPRARGGVMGGIVVEAGPEAETGESVVEIVRERGASDVSKSLFLGSSSSFEGLFTLPSLPSPFPVDPWPSSGEIVMSGYCSGNSGSGGGGSMFLKTSPLRNHSASTAALRLSYTLSILFFLFLPPFSASPESSASVSAAFATVPALRSALVSSRMS
ncbi:hypothetical protein BKA80DRAFT_282164 [Phyllosticta citrichinensis]